MKNFLCTSDYFRKIQLWLSTSHLPSVRHNSLSLAHSGPGLGRGSTTSPTQCLRQVIRTPIYLPATPGCPCTLACQLSLISHTQHGLCDLSQSHQHHTHTHTESHMDSRVPTCRRDSVGQGLLPPDHLENFLGGGTGAPILFFSLSFHTFFLLILLLCALH